MRYCNAVCDDKAKNKPDSVFVKLKAGLLEKHEEGRYYMSHNSEQVVAGSDAPEIPPCHGRVSGFIGRVP
jgi:hypothetical protein